MKLQIDDFLFKKYEQIYESDKTNRVFASLADVYRKSGFLEKALSILKLGTKTHPNFAGGFLGLAKVYIDLQDIPSAIDALLRVVEIAPDSLVAHKMLAELYLRQADMKNALTSFERVLFISPYDTRAKTQASRIEKLLSNDGEQFQMQKPECLSGKEPSGKEPTTKTEPKFTPYQKKKSFNILKRYLSLADAYILRSNTKKALNTLKEAEQELGKHDELTRRFAMLSSRNKLDNEDPTESLSDERKIQILQGVLDRVHTNSRD